jgi:Zn-finger nucleic acid-binding protein
MTSTGSLQGPEIQVELKYCERCGGLWLRRQEAKGVYCAPCRARLEARPKPPEASAFAVRCRKRRQRETAPQRENLRSSARIDYLQGVAALEARA